MLLLPKCLKHEWPHSFPSSPSLWTTFLFLAPLLVSLYKIFYFLKPYSNKTICSGFIKIRWWSRYVVMWPVKRLWFCLKTQRNQCWLWFWCVSHMKPRQLDSFSWQSVYQTLKQNGLCVIRFMSTSLTNQIVCCMMGNRGRWVLASAIVRAADALNSMMTW